MEFEVLSTATSTFSNDNDVEPTFQTLSPPPTQQNQNEPQHSSTSENPTTTRQTLDQSFESIAKSIDPESLPQYQQMLEEDYDKTAAWAIHIALILFFSLVCISILLAFVVIHNYGFIALLLLSIMVLFVLFLAYFVDQTILKKNENLKPVRHKIVTALEKAHQAVVEEFHLFREDWHEYNLLLTNGEDPIQQAEQPSPTTTSTKMRRKKSKLFKLVKPFVGKLFKRKRKKTNNNDSSEYNPPAAVELV